MVGKRQKRRTKKKDVVHAPKQAEPSVTQSSPKGFSGFEKIYHDNYKQLLLIPFAILIIAIIILGINVATTGQLIATGVSLSGGLTLTVPTQGEAIAVEQTATLLREAFPNNDILVREVAEFGEQKAISVQVAPATKEENLEELEQGVVNTLAQNIPYIQGNYNIEIIGPSLGNSFLQQTLIALVIAFLFMALVVFYYFRTFVPSLAVVLAAFSDMVVTLAVVSVMDMKLGTAGIAAFLMLIGYSVDTDILLSTRVLKRKVGTVYERIKTAIRTGLIMNTTTLVAITVALVVTQSEVIEQIMIILLIGLLVDVINTWIQNAGILRWYLEREQ